MKVVFIAILVALVGCASAPPSPIDVGTTLFGRHGEVRAIELLLRVETSQRLRDGSWQVVARGSYDAKDFDCILSIPVRWSDYSPSPGFKRADIIFADTATGAILEALIQRHFQKVPSVYLKSGFGVFSRDSAERIDQEPFEFQGFANDPDGGEFGELQCLAFVDLPRRYLKLAFLVEGYGGSPPDEVYRWLRKRANLEGSDSPQRESGPRLNKPVE